jgi:S-(hydroxymethyl)glutathione dehydrogenase/alcohol dehydrogenase
MTHFINPKDIAAAGGNIVDAIVQLTDGGADYSFECIGNTTTMRQALECTPQGLGPSIIIGVAEAGPRSARAPSSWSPAASGWARPSAAHAAAPTCPRSSTGTWTASSSIDELITHTLKLEQINEGFDLMKRGESIRSVVVY